MALSIEASELNELFLWKKSEDADQSKIKEELADVLSYTLLLAHHYQLDINKIVLEKIKLNDKKYPVDKAKGNAKNMWPIVYMLSDHLIKEAHVGETTDAYARMNSHIKNEIKNRLDTVHLFTNDKFNKSATLDIESNLIKYISGDGQYKLLNANVGLTNHNFYEKDYYWDLFKSLWATLKKEGIAKHSLEYINNSDLFKYSPYKSLSADQRKGLLMVVKNLLSDDLKTIIIEGGAGTGKTILTIFVFKLLCTDIDEFNFRDFGNDELEFVALITRLKIKYPKPKMALVIPMSSFRGTIKKVFKNANMVIGPADLTKEKFDIRPAILCRRSI